MSSPGTRSRYHPTLGIPLSSPPKKTNFAGPIAGGVSLQTRTPVCIDDIDTALVKQPPSARSRLFRNTRTRFAAREVDPHVGSGRIRTRHHSPSGEMQLSSTNRHIPPAVLAMEDKVAQHLNATLRRRKLRSVQKLCSSKPESSHQTQCLRQSLNAETGAQLLPEMRMLRERVDELQQAQRPPGSPIPSNMFVSEKVPDSSAQILLFFLMGTTLTGYSFFALR
ncbi:hypothetical protein B0H19DRAFT_1256721 [Mycena capillaripes]|nr:hypothetical protein B0H19DRAFT_1256721 [Mycena capillaripes]